MDQPIELESELEGALSTRAVTESRRGAVQRNVVSIAGALRQQQEAGREREQHFYRLLDALPAAVYTTDAAGRITYFNEAAAALWGQRPPLGTSEWCGSAKLY
ncbi:MAG: PAS domain-containing protein, partial [Pseudolabrys sp.]